MNRSLRLTDQKICKFWPGTVDLCRRIATIPVDAGSAPPASIVALRFLPHLKGLFCAPMDSA